MLNPEYNLANKFRGGYVKTKLFFYLVLFLGMVCSHNVVLCALLRGGRIKGVRRINLQNHIF